MTMQTANIEQDIRNFLMENFMAGRAEQLPDGEMLLQENDQLNHSAGVDHVAQQSD